MNPGAEEAHHGHDRDRQEQVDADRRAGDRPLPRQRGRLEDREKDPGHSRQQQDDAAVAMESSPAEGPSSKDGEDRGGDQGEEGYEHREERQRDRGQAADGLDRTIAPRRGPCVVLSQPREDRDAEDADGDCEDDEPYEGIAAELFRIFIGERCNSTTPAEARGPRRLYITRDLRGGSRWRGARDGGLPPPVGWGRLEQGEDRGGGRPRSSKPSLYNLVSMDQIERARQLRRAMTDAERHLWRRIRLNSLGVQFRRQVPIGPYIVDFACLRRRLVVELDGGQHLENPADRVRDESLEAAGYRVLRFWNHEVLKNVEGVLERILAEVEGRAELGGGGEAEGCL